MIFFEGEEGREMHLWWCVAGRSVRFGLEDVEKLERRSWLSLRET